MPGLRAIFTYHSIDDSRSAISVAPLVFEEHVRWLSQGTVRVTSLERLLALDPHDPGDAVALTFDDGFANFMTAAALLEAHGLAATLFVVSGHVGGTNAWRGRSHRGIPTLPLLTWSNLEHLSLRGFAIGAHTRTHPSLPGLAPAEVEDEMDRCVSELGGRLGVAPLSFAYPYGALDDRVAASAAARFSVAVTADFDTVRTDSPRHRLPRLDMYYFRDPGALARWNTRGFARRLRWIAARRRLRRAITAGESA